jgi:adenylate kinase
MKRVILVTGTPCVGKTTTAKALAAKLCAHYINLTDFAKNHKLTTGEDEARHTTIIDEDSMSCKLAEAINQVENDIVVDGHYAAAVTPTELVSKVFVLRRCPKELKTFMQKCGFTEPKIYENLAAEILDSCFVEALQYHKEPGKVCELDVTGKTVEDVVSEILDLLKTGLCHRGIVDWLGMLEEEGVLDEYLKA